MVGQDSSQAGLCEALRDPLAFPMQVFRGEQRQGTGCQQAPTQPPESSSVYHKSYRGPQGLGEEQNPARKGKLLSTDRQHHSFRAESCRQKQEDSTPKITAASTAHATSHKREVIQCMEEISFPTFPPAAASPCFSPAEAEHVLTLAAPRRACPTDPAERALPCPELFIPPCSGSPSPLQGRRFADGRFLLPAPSPTANTEHLTGPQALQPTPLHRDAAQGPSFGGVSLPQLSLGRSSGEGQSQPALLLPLTHLLIPLITISLLA